MRHPRNLRRRPGRVGWFGSYKAADGRWHERLLVGARTQAEAARVLWQLEAKAFAEREQLGGPRRDPTIAEVTAAWQAAVATRCRPTTRLSYAQGLATVGTWLLKRALANDRKPPERVSELRVEDFRAWAATALENGLSARTVNLRIAIWRACFRWAIAEGLVGASPLARWRAVAGPQVRNRQPLTAHEAVRLLGASPAHYRDIWQLILGTGLRAGELASLEWRDLDLAAAELRVRGEVSKSARPRTIPLRPELVSLLRRRQAQPGPRRRGCEALVFANAAGGSWRLDLSRRLKTCLKRAGLRLSIDVHTLRHTFGSQLIAAGADVKSVQELLGHASALVTLDVYAHAFGDRKRAAVEALPPLGTVDHPAQVRPALRAAGQ